MRSLLRFLHRQKGYTITEILIALAISGMLAAGITATIVQIFNENTRATRNMQVVQNVENAGYWVNRDTLMAQSISSASGFLTMQWQDTDFSESNNYAGNTYVVSYIVTNGELRRTITINSGSSVQTTVARYVDSADYSYDMASRSLTFTVTTAIGSTSETRVYEIKLRSDANA